MDKPPKVTRKELLELLAMWERGELTAQEVWDWTNARCWPAETETDDWEGDVSATDEILAHLDSMDIHFVIVKTFQFIESFWKHCRERRCRLMPYGSRSLMPSITNSA